MRSFAVLFALAVLAAPVFADLNVDTETVTGFVAPNGGPVWTPSRDVLYDNGPLLTHPGGGYGGADASVLQTALGLSTYGFGMQHTLPNSMADDFVVPQGETWTIEQLTVFGYQTGSSTTSTFTGVYFQIMDDTPPGGNVIYGDMVTNRLVTTAFSGMYRVLDTSMMDTNRPIMANVCAFDPPLVLGEGWYWLAFDCTGSLSSGPWAPPVTILGMTTTGDGLQYTASSGMWNNLIDTGTGTGQGVPFILEGTGGCSPVETSTWGQVKALFQ